jgi:hypothetical protein
MRVILVACEHEQVRGARGHDDLVLDAAGTRVEHGPASERGRASREVPRLPPNAVRSECSFILPSALHRGARAALEWLA